MPERREAEALFLANLDWVERSVASICRRYGLRGEEAEDLASWTKLKLIEDDYAILRKFRGDSSIRTYLMVVVAALFRDYRAGAWGRWRPSAAALRRGRLAVRLETLIYRDGCTFDHAEQMLRAAGETDLPGRELVALFAELPRRGPMRPGRAGIASVETLPGADTAESRVTAAEAERERDAVYGALLQALDRLPHEDGLILRLQYWKGFSVAEIARALRLPQKPLYRRIERLLTGLRRELEARGIGPEQLRRLLEELPPLEEGEGGVGDTGAARPSNQVAPGHEEAFGD